jgi:mono/diheme cytochrome c family protein
MTKSTQALLIIAALTMPGWLQASEAQVKRGEAIATEAACASCHTPPGGAPYSGNQLGGWVAYNITSDPQAGIGNWSDEELLDYLRSGHVDGKAQAAGPMTAVIENTTASLSDGDLKALAAYIRAIPAANPTGEMRNRADYGQAVSEAEQIRGKPFAATEIASGARLYLGNCAACHGTRGDGGGGGYYPSLVGNSAVGAATADNLVNVILHGVSRKADGKEYYMPGFAGALTDGEVVSLAGFVLRHFGRPEVKVTLADVKSRR